MKTPAYGEQEAGTGIKYFDSTTHRKIRYYRLFEDGVDANGHGTHCAGSVMGYPASGGPSVSISACRYL